MALLSIFVRNSVSFQWNDFVRNPITIPKLRTRQLRYNESLFRSVWSGVFVISKLFNVINETYVVALLREIKMIRFGVQWLLSSSWWEYSNKITNWRESGIPSLLFCGVRSFLPSLYSHRRVGGMACSTEVFSFISTPPTETTFTRQPLGDTLNIPHTDSCR